MNVDKYRDEIVSVVRDAVIGPVPRLVATREWAADVLERALAEQREAIAQEILSDRDKEWGNRDHPRDQSYRDGRYDGACKAAVIANTHGKEKS